MLNYLFVYITTSVRKTSRLSVFVLLSCMIAIEVWNIFLFYHFDFYQNGHFCARTYIILIINIELSSLTVLVINTRGSIVNCYPVRQISAIYCFFLSLRRSLK